MSRRYHLYLGKAGQLHAMAEFLLRGWNVAIPEVDEGDDIFVVSGKEGILMRAQVKAAMVKGKRTAGSFSATYSIKASQIAEQEVVPLHFIFLCRTGDNWHQPVIIRQDRLREIILENRQAVPKSRNISLYFRYSGEGVRLGNADIGQHISDYSSFPRLSL